MLHKYKILLPFLSTIRSYPYPQRFLPGFILNSSYHEDNTLVSFFKYKITYWLCISNHRICSISFSRNTALDFPVEKEQVVMICDSSSTLFSFISPFSLSFWRMHSYSLWWRGGGSTGSKVWAHLEVQPGEGCWEPKQNEAANLWRGGVAWCDLTLEGWLAVGFQKPSRLRCLYMGWNYSGILKPRWGEDGVYLSARVDKQVLHVVAG